MTGSSTTAPSASASRRRWVAKLVAIAVLAAATAVDLRGAIAHKDLASSAAATPPVRAEGPPAATPEARADVPVPAARTGRPAERDETAATPTETTVPSPPRRVRVPAVGIDAEVIDVGLDDEGRLEVPPAADTVGWWSGGSAPEEDGPTVLVAHLDWAGELGIFHELSRLEVGDVIDVVDEAGGRSRFVVEGIEQHAKTAFPTEAVYGRTATPSLRLVTCAGPFDRTAGHYTDNLVVFAARAPGRAPTGSR